MPFSQPAVLETEVQVPEVEVPELYPLAAQGTVGYASQWNRLHMV
jgi:hypothetical protein